MPRYYPRSIISQISHLFVKHSLLFKSLISAYVGLLLIGVWTRETIPVRTCFGPLIGQQSHSLEVADWTDKAASHIWKVSGCPACRLLRAFFSDERHHMTQQLWQG